MEGIRSREAWKGKTFIISTNNIKMFDYADKIAILEEGCMEFFGTREEMMQSPRIKTKIDKLIEAKNSLGVLDQSARKDKKPKEGETEQNQGNPFGGGQEIGSEIEEFQKAENLDFGQNPEKEIANEINEASMEPNNEAKQLFLTQDTQKIELPKNQQNDQNSFFFSEDKAQGSLSFSVIQRYINGSGGVIFFLITYFGFPYLLTWGFNESKELLVEWGDKYTGQGIKDSSLITPLVTLVFLQGFCGFMRRFTVYIGLVLLGRQMHAKMIFRILHAKINGFLKRVPMGQIINRFSNDIDVIDKETGDLVYRISRVIPKNLLNVFLISIGVKNPYMVIPLVLFIFIAFWMRVAYMRAKTEMVRLFQITRSPVIGLASSCILGAPVIRCIKNQPYLQKKIEKLINENTKNRLLDISLDAWFAINLNLFDFFIVQIPCYGLLIWTLYYSEIQTVAEYTRLTLFLQLVTEFSQELILLLNRLCLTEGRFISIERCQNFEKIEPEAGYKRFGQDSKIFEIPRRNLKDANQALEAHQRRDLFASGRIEIKGVSARYPTARKNVLTKISLEIEPGEKVGIVGRTGAGKSSFIKLLWRGMEVSEGEILVDGINIKNIGLKEYREQITVISQQTNLFEGSIALNISPKPIPEPEILRLQKTLKRLKFPEEKLEDGNLMFQLDTDASNLSEGEKQIISYVRGVFNKRKIVILDEASAYVDNETEKGFKELADEEFSESTMFVIAHRIQTVIDCDKILVLDDGRVLEFDAPGVLLADPESEFSKICAKS